MKTKILSLLLVAFLTSTAFGWSYEDEKVWAPTVPASVIRDGRQEVQRNLQSRIENAYVEFGGRSVVNYQASYLNRDNLRARGYIHDGSMTEFVNAMKGIQFEGEVMKTPEGHYDLQVHIICLDKEGKVLQRGFGSLGIRAADNCPPGYTCTHTAAPVSGGGASSPQLIGTFEPYMNMPSYIGINVEGGGVNGAKWVGPNWQDEDLDIQYTPFGGARRVIFSTSHLDTGILMVAGPAGKIEGIDLRNHVDVSGKDLRAAIGNIENGDVKTFPELSTLSLDWTKVAWAYHGEDGRIYGRVPLVDFTTKGIKENFQPYIKVWPEDKYILPSKVSIKPVFTQGPVPEMNNLPVVKGGGYNINLPAGGYHLEMEFDDLLDFRADPNPGKG